MAETTFDPASFLATANPGRTVSTYRTDDVIFSQEAPADAIFYIQAGSIKLVITSSQGKEAIVAMLRTGEFFGEGCLIGQPLRLAWSWLDHERERGVCRRRRRRQRRLLSY